MKLIQICVQRTGSILGCSHHVRYGPSICFRNLLMNSYQQLISRSFSCKSHALLDTRRVAIQQLPNCQGTFSSDRMCIDLGSRTQNLQLRQHSFSKGSNRNEREIQEKANSDEDIKDWHRNQMLRLTTENDLLSRCRNTYIMTLVALSAAQAESIPLCVTVSGVAVVTAELNLIFGTCFYLSNVYKLWKTGKSSSMSSGQLASWTVLHFILWTIILGLLLPSGNKLDKELKNYIEDDA